MNREPVVVWDPDAVREYEMIDQRDERDSLYNVVKKLRAHGDKLPFPHSSAVRGSTASVRELRPRAGKSAYRVLYRRFGGYYVILAIATKSDFARQTRIADSRASRYPS